ncbi:MAG: GNAT family N-acetyltransferase [Oceanihabitans sp.]
MHLDLHQLYCNISEDNNASKQLFTKQGFREIGLKKDWNLVKNKFKNEYIFQLINH